MLLQAFSGIRPDEGDGLDYCSITHSFIIGRMLTTLDCRGPLARLTPEVDHAH